MDPTQALKDAQDADARQDWPAALDATQTLLEWLRLGGFAPSNHTHKSARALAEQISNRAWAAIKGDKMKRVYHVIYCPSGGTARDERVCGSFDHFQDAREAAQQEYVEAPIGGTVLVRCMGVVEWGPFTKGEKV